MSKTGNCNIDDDNSGYYNSGDHNIGDYNTGDYNTGHWNSGNRNSGRFNTGHYNTGNCNTGHYNTGYRNIGHYNTGNCNTGHYNTGNRNSGDWNTGDYNTGCFNTVEQTILLFNKPSPWTYREWWKSKAKKLLDCMPQSTAWVNSDDMTDAEKAKYPTYETTGGYLKTFDAAERTDAAIKWWQKLTDDERETIMEIPNFDKEIFKEITGIDVDAHEWN